MKYGKKGIFELAVEHVGNLALEKLARSVDEAHEDIVHSSERNARTYRELAENYKAGRFYTSNPSASSSVYDLPMLIGRAEARRDAFWELAASILVEKEFRALKVSDMVRAGLEEVKDES